MDLGEAVTCLSAGQLYADVHRGRHLMFFITFKKHVIDDVRSFLHPHEGPMMTILSHEGLRRGAG